MSRPRKTPGFIERRGNSYRITLCVRGMRHRFTVTDRSRAYAEQRAREVYDVLLAEEERKERERTAPPPPLPRDMLALIDRFEAEDLPEHKRSTRECYRKSVAPLRVFFTMKGNPDVTEVTTAVVREFHTWRRTYHPAGKPGRRPRSAGGEGTTLAADGTEKGAKTGGEQETQLQPTTGGQAHPIRLGNASESEQVQTDKTATPPTPSAKSDVSPGTKPSRTKPLAARTLRRDLGVLRLIFRRAADEQLVRGDNPVKAALEHLPRLRKFRPIILSDTEYAALVRQTTDNPTLHFYVILLAESGLRCDSEALHLRWEDIDLDQGFLHVVTGRDADGIAQPLSSDDEHTTKNDESRVVPITPTLREAVLAFHSYICEQCEITGTDDASPWVFQHFISTRGVQRGDRMRSLYKQFRAAARSAGLHRRLRQHDLRHRRVTTWLGAGHSATIVMQAMGHKNLQTTMDYYQYVPEHMRPLQQASLQSLVGPAAIPAPAPTQAVQDCELTTEHPRRSRQR